MTFTEEILNAHNNYRTEVEVPPLQWSEDLAASAQQWANKLAQTGTFEHSQAGENLAEGTTGAFSVTQLVDMWGGEKQYFSNGTFPMYLVQEIGRMSVITLKLFGEIQQKLGVV